MIPANASSELRQDEPTITGGYSEAFLDGNLLPGFTQAAYGNSFIQSTRTLAQFIDHVLRGRSVVTHQFTGNTRKNETFIRAQVFGLDLESPERDVSVADVCAIPFNREHAFLVHATRSSGIVVPEHNPEGYKRSRAYFRASEPIEGLERARAVAQALALACGLPMDAASFKPAQPWNGSTNRIEEPHINPDALSFDVRWVAGYLIDTARAEMERALAPKVPLIQPSGTRAERYAAAAYANELSRLENTPSGERNQALFTCASKLFSYALGEWPGITEGQVQRELEAVIRTWSNVPKSLNTIRNARRKATATPLELKDTHIVARSQAQIAPLQPQASSKPFKPLSFHQATPFMLCCPEYVLIELHVVHLCQVDDFTAADLAESAAVSQDTAQRWIDRAMRWEAVSEVRSADLQAETFSLKTKTACKNAERPVHGAAVARRYRVTRDRAEARIKRELPNYVQELMDRGEPGPIYQEEALSAGLDPVTATQIEQVSTAASRTREAFEVSAQVEREAVQKAHELQRQAEDDEQSFAPDQLPSSVSNLRVQRLESLLATKIGEICKHSEMMWVAGVKLGSISALIRKSAFVAAPASCFVDVPLKGHNLRRAVRKCCCEYHGAAVAWLDKDGNVLGDYSPDMPYGAVGVRLNLGKTYRRREKIEASTVPVAAQGQCAAETPPVTLPSPHPQNPETQRQKHARAVVMSRLRGCLKALGWYYTPGPYGYWERGDQTKRNTFAEMTEALRQDYPWACAERTQSEIGDSLCEFAEALGAVVTELPAPSVAVPVVSPQPF